MEFSPLLVSSWDALEIKDEQSRGMKPIKVCVCYNLKLY